MPPPPPADRPGPDQASSARDGIVAEVPLPAGPGQLRFGQAEGPFARYERTVAIDGGRVVGHHVEVRLGLPVVGRLLDPPLRRLLGRAGPDPGFPWWLPPARLARPAATELLALCCLEVLLGYVAELPGYTVAYAAPALGAGRAGQGLALGVLQLSAALALPALAVADRARARRRPVVGGLVLAGCATAAGATAWSLAALTVAALVAGAAATVASVMVGVRVVEAMPAGARAWGLAVATMSVGLGGGVAVAVIPLAAAGPDGWRWCYLAGVLVVPAAAWLGRWLPARADRAREPRVAIGGGRRQRASRRRLAVLASGTVLLAVFSAPAGALQVGYLRSERHLSAAAISVLLQVTGTVGGLGTLVGGRLADTRGRRPVAAVGVVALAATGVAVYAAAGAALWVAETASSVVGYAIAPALGVYGAELFPSGERGRAGGVLTVAGALAGLGGTALAGLVAARGGATLPAVAALAVGPLLLAVLVWRAYPETAGRSLDELAGG